MRPEDHYAAGAKWLEQAEKETGELADDVEQILHALVLTQLANAHFMAARAAVATGR